MTDPTQYFALNKKKLPKVSDVLEFVISRSTVVAGRSKMSRSAAIHDMATEVYSIWFSANCAP